MARPLPIFPHETLLRPATLDLAQHIGATLATLPNIPANAAQRARLNRIASHLNPSAHRRMIEAMSDAAKAARS